MKSAKYCGRNKKITIVTLIYHQEQNKSILLTFPNVGLGHINSQEGREEEKVNKENKFFLCLQHPASSKIQSSMHIIIGVGRMPWHLIKVILRLKTIIYN